MSGLFAQDLADAEAAVVAAKLTLDVATSRWVARQLTHAEWYALAKAYGVAVLKRDDLAAKAARPMRGPVDALVRG